MDSEIVGSIDMNDITVDARSFSWAVDSAIKSETASILGESTLHSFASLVNHAIWSRTSSNLGTSPSPVHPFASALNIKTNPATRLSQVEGVPNATRYAAQLFTLAQLEKATNIFSLHNKIRDDEYSGKLVDGREVTIQRKKSTRYVSDFGKREFSLLSRLHHKNLVRLVGFCEKKHERLLVYEYMKNGALYNHLHEGKGSSVLNSWKMRIKIALDASQGIQYLHYYAVPSTIHRDIKSSNILLDATWTARISDFEFSLMSPEPDDENDEAVVATFGYLDPEYYRRNVVPAKIDVYAFGVVLLELLTGKTADRIIKSLDFAVSAIQAGEMVKVLDLKVGKPDVNEAEALEILAHTAIHCVELKWEHRPTMTDIVVKLERALAICDTDSSPYDSISSSTKTTNKHYHLY